MRTSTRRSGLAPWAAVVLLGQLACSPPTVSSALPSSTVPGPSTPLLQPEIHGLVHEVDGGAVAGVRIARFDTKSAVSTTQVSDADGRFVFASQPGSTEVQISVVNLPDPAKYFPRVNLDLVVGATSSPAPVAVEFKLQRSARLDEYAALEFTVTDDALSFGYPGLFSCGPCLGFTLKPARIQDFDLHVQTSGTGLFRVLLVGDKDYHTVLFGAVASRPGASEVVLRVPRTQLEGSPYEPDIYIERARGLPPQSFRMKLVPVE